MSDETQASKPVRTKYAELLIDGIVGVGLPTIDFAEYAERQGFATFTGNQHNPEWKWVRERLEHCDEQELLSIYVQAKNVKAKKASKS